jgi:putative oxidoreductase
MKAKIAALLNRSLVKLSARFLLGGVFIYASIDKIVYPKEFASIVTRYQILPEKLAIYFAFLLPWVELFLGIFVLLGIFIRESAISLSFLVMIFMVAIAIRALSGPIGNCGCFRITSSGTTQSIVFLIFRDVLFLLCGLILALTNKAEKLRLSILSRQY